MILWFLLMSYDFRAYLEPKNIFINIHAIWDKENVSLASREKVVKNPTDS